MSQIEETIKNMMFSDLATAALKTKEGTVGFTSSKSIKTLLEETIKEILVLEKVVMPNYEVTLGRQRQIDFSKQKARELGLNLE